MERFAQLGKSCAPFARGDWNAAKVTTRWGHKVTVLPGVTVVNFHSDVIISDC